MALMILKFIEAPLLSSSDEAEAIAVLNDFLSNLGKKTNQEPKVLDEETVKVSWTLNLILGHTYAVEIMLS